MSATRHCERIIALIDRCLAEIEGAAPAEIDATAAASLEVEIDRRRPTAAGNRRRPAPHTSRLSGAASA
jgi:hypothetical protein